MRRPGPDHRKADPLECLRKVQHERHSPSILCFCPSIKSFHFHQYFPHCTLSSSISPVINAILLLPLCHFWCSQGFPPTINVGISGIGLSLVTFFGIKKNIVAGLLRPLATLLHFLQEFHHFSPGFFCQVQRNFRVESVASHSCFCLVQSRCPCPDRLLSISATLPHIPPTPNSSMACSAYSVFPRHIANTLPILSSSPHNDLTTSRLLLPASESAPFLSTSLAS